MRAHTARTPRSSPATSRPTSAGRSHATSPPARSTSPATARPTQDSHLELPTVSGDIEDGLEPFRAAIAAGVQTIMTAHVRVPALDDAPATLSRAIIGDLLRGELGFDGLVLADALEMKAVSATVGIEEAAVRALQAGVDALIMGHDLGADDLCASGMRSSRGAGGAACEAAAAAGAARRGLGEGRRRHRRPHRWDGCGPACAPAGR